MLTVHHPDHDTLNPDARLEVLCAPCHLRADHAHHVERARRSRVVTPNGGQLSLMEVEAT